jgi:hypothetical protein
MKFLLIILISTVVLASCAKDNKANDDCTAVTITNSAPGCGGWGIVVNNTKYPSKNIPDQFKQNGMAVCANYELYQDPTMCPCCGGTWADIKTMKTFVR